MALQPGTTEIHVGARERVGIPNTYSHVEIWASMTFSVPASDNDDDYYEALQDKGRGIVEKYVAEEREHVLKMIQEGTVK